VICDHNSVTLGASECRCCYCCADLFPRLGYLQSPHPDYSDLAVRVIFGLLINRRHPPITDPTGSHTALVVLVLCTPLTSYSPQRPILTRAQLMEVVTCDPDDPDAWVCSFNVQWRRYVERLDEVGTSTFVLPDPAIFP
jgi:hypothetical protein